MVASKKALRRNLTIIVTSTQSKALHALHAYIADELGFACIPCNSNKLFMLACKVSHLAPGNEVSDIVGGSQLHCFVTRHDQNMSLLICPHPAD